MTTAWRIPLCAHVCTPEDAPAVQRANTYLAALPDLQNSSEILHREIRRLKPSNGYQLVLIDAVWALDLKINEWMHSLIQRNGLLHYGVDNAIALAKTASEAASNGGSTC